MEFEQKNSINDTYNWKMITTITNHHLQNGRIINRIEIAIVTLDINFLKTVHLKFIIINKNQVDIL